MRLLTPSPSSPREFTLRPDDFFFLKVHFAMKAWKFRGSMLHNILWKSHPTNSCPPPPAPGGIRSRCLGRWKAPLQQPEHVGALGLRFISSPVPKQTAVWQRKAYAAFHRAQAPLRKGSGTGFPAQASRGVCTVHSAVCNSTAFAKNSKWTTTRNAHN